ncbi:30S ribosomal protein S20 [[Mycoplasma] mobile]|uniref:Small ribosomal subunit protein bS20 n=1 Tax=Mycoplasma mobile (strain ATCC 43663 / 163K / NCTC 11711) TaxID=267748 RepID=RS20_MYCM1|nr:30S ribosomal protein S20 [[Mycoplasma] mobile]Q6KHC4.1 RecName: Full=Small ribosomal subunit protein bS20; AltName: Full=30S ribosomal protein S20 [Mycoplasma mobile 163K]AAT28006.1 30S ribosomal protein s20 [Mycoplasma mobile 163K]
MANIKSKEKRILTNEKARVRNAAMKSHVRLAIKKAKRAIEEKNENVEQLLKDAHKVINTSVSHGVFHRNNAARKSSRLDAYAFKIQNKTAN